MSERYSPFRNPVFIRRALEHPYREEADRKAWLAGVQKRLGLVTRENVDSLLEVRLEKLRGVTWPS